MAGTRRDRGQSGWQPRPLTTPIRRRMPRCSCGAASILASPAAILQWVIDPLDDLVICAVLPPRRLFIHDYSCSAQFQSTDFTDFTKQGSVPDRESLLKLTIRHIPSMPTIVRGQIEIQRRYPRDLADYQSSSQHDYHREDPYRLASPLTPEQIYHATIEAAVLLASALSVLARDSKHSLADKVENFGRARFGADI